MSTDTFVCSVCSKINPALAKFPNSLCVECYALTPEANAPITARQLAQMWGGK
jgi:hypothetical protein